MAPIPGWKPLVFCEGTTADPCEFPELVELVKVIITDLVIISTLIAVIVFIYAGFKLMTSRGNSSAMEDVKKMLWSIVIGYLWILGAWLIVYTITSVLLNDGYSLLGSPKKN